METREKKPQGPGQILSHVMESLPLSGRVLVAMSGGVDSSVAAWLLAQRGLDVSGATLRLFPPEREERIPQGALQGLASIQRAREACEELGIPHIILDASDRFWQEVVGPFLDDYASGRTPNPCIRCNRLVKWETLLEEARRRDCAYLATGHYARLLSSEGRQQILRGLDQRKDQSYALHGLSQSVLNRTLLPLGSLKKSEVRRIAADAGLPTSETAESQDLCFIPRGGHERFITEHVRMNPGSIEDVNGRILGMHRGLGLYTVGQRKGLGIPHGTPLYVLRKDAGGNRLIVGAKEDLGQRSFLAGNVNWVSMTSPSQGSSFPAEVEVRYRSRPIPGEIFVLGPECVEVRLAAHTQAIAPGQSVVWYLGDLLLGGGIIMHPDVLPETEDYV